VFLSLLLVHGNRVPVAVPRIVGGTPAAVGEFPYAAFLASDIGGGFVAICDGTLISGHYLLTAAHCCISSDGLTTNAAVRPGTIVYIGGYFSDDMLAGQPLGPSGAGEAQQVVETTFPSTYVPGVFDDDICVVRISQAANQPVRVRLNLNDPLFDLTGTATVIGWGTTAENGTESNPLLKANVNIVARATCAAAYSDFNINKICASAPGKDSCQGDSGGPLLKSNGTELIQIGLVSYGIGCARPLFPGVYTRISSYMSFICANSANEPIGCPGGGTDDGVGPAPSPAASALSHSFFATLVAFLVQL